MNLVFLGAAGSGKGTQAKRLEADFGLRQISTGDLLREAVRQGSPLGQQAAPLMREGRLVPDALVIGIIEEQLATMAPEQGLLFDGFPRTLAQAEALDEALARLGRKLDRVIAFDVPETLLFERITGRRSCPVCGAVYHVKYNPPKVEGVCDRDGSALIQREDDTADKLEQRLSVFRRENPAVKGHYASQGLLAEVDASVEPHQVFQAIRQAIGE